MADISIIEMATCVMKGVAKGLEEKCAMAVTDLPVVEKNSQNNVWIIMDTPGMFVSSLQFTRTISGREYQNIGILYISKAKAVEIFRNSGVTERSMDEEISGLCGGLCTAMVGAFKAELGKVDQAEVTVDKVKNYSNKAKEQIPMKGACQNYGLMVYNAGRHVLSVDFVIQEVK
ncbi:MAG: hypothetical protein HQL30_10855 [Candidatus Omnitrophica bacterium]|nr:hypothetical protein [Candidatus Omnitrophota bacterium]